LPFQVAAGHIVEKHARRLRVLACVAGVERDFDLLLAGTQIVQGAIEIVFIESGQSQHFRHGVILGPTHRR